MKNTSEKSDAALVLEHMKRNSRPGLLIVALVLLLVAAATYFTPKQYRSEALVYPAAHSHPDPEIVQPALGGEHQSDRLIQLFSSGKMREMLAGQLEVWGETNGRHPEKKSWFKRHFSIQRIPEGGVELAVTDEDAEIAQRMAAFVVHKVDTLYGTILSSNMERNLRRIERKMKAKKMRIDQLADSVIQIKSKTAGSGKEKITDLIGESREKYLSLENQLSQLQKNANTTAFEAEIATLREMLLENERRMEFCRRSLEKWEDKNPPDSLFIRLSAQYEAAKTNEERWEKRLDELLQHRYQNDLLRTEISREKEIVRDLTNERSKLQSKLEPYINTVELREVEAEYSLQRELYSELSKRYEKLATYYTTAVPGVYVLSAPQIPEQPYRPSWKLNLLLGLAGGIGLWIGFLIIRAVIAEKNEA